MASSPARPLALLEVLIQLPPEELREIFWLRLDCGRAFRQANRQSRQLADKLIQHVKLELRTRAGDDAELQRQAAFIARQEGLQQLTLCDNAAAGAGEPLFIKSLLLGGDVCQQLRILHLETCSACTAATARAIHLCCPNICELELYIEWQLSGAFFEGLRRCYALSEVKIDFMNDGEDCGELLPSLTLLPSLRTLTLAGDLAAAAVDLLAGFTRLQRLDASMAVVRATPGICTRLGRALGGLTQLTSLALPNLWKLYEQPPEERVDAVVAQLGGLRRLVGLGFCNDGSGPLLSTGLAALRRRSSLTRLTCTAAAEQAMADPGCLPLLEELEILSY